MTQRVAVYPGTFDPITLGHMDIIRRSTHLVDTLVVGVTTNPSKSPMFSVDERLAMVQRELADLPNVRVVTFNSLLMDFAESQGANVILRGLRAVARTRTSVAGPASRIVLRSAADGTVTSTSTEMSRVTDGYRGSGSTRRSRPALARSRASRSMSAT